MCLVYPVDRIECSSSRKPSLTRSWDRPPCRKALGSEPLSTDTFASHTACHSALSRPPPPATVPSGWNNICVLPETLVVNLMRVKTQTITFKTIPPMPRTVLDTEQVLTKLEGVSR